MLILSIYGYAQASDPDPQLIKEDRIKRYIAEFVSGDIRLNYPQIFKALINTVEKLPDDVFDEISNRERPVVFLNSITSGIARFAHSNEFTVEEDDPPTFSGGFFVIILGDELNNAENVEAIEGVIAHEIAHRYLENIKAYNAGAEPCALERKANHTIQEWGFSEEFAQAKDVFGAKKRGDSPCSDLEL